MKLTKRHFKTICPIRRPDKENVALAIINGIDGSSTFYSWEVEKLLETAATLMVDSGVSYTDTHTGFQAFVSSVRCDSVDQGNPKLGSMYTLILDVAVTYGPEQDFRHVTREELELITVRELSDLTWFVTVHEDSFASFKNRFKRI